MGRDDHGTTSCASIGQATAGRPPLVQNGVAAPCVTPLRSHWASSVQRPGVTSWFRVWRHLPVADGVNADGHPFSPGIARLRRCHRLSGNGGSSGRRRVLPKPGGRAGPARIGLCTPRQGACVSVMWGGCHSTREPSSDNGSAGWRDRYATQPNAGLVPARPDDRPKKHSKTDHPHSPAPDGKAVPNGKTDFPPLGGLPTECLWNASPWCADVSIVDAPHGLPRYRAATAQTGLGAAAGFAVPNRPLAPTLNRRPLRPNRGVDGERLPAPVV